VGKPAIDDDGNIIAFWWCELREEIPINAIGRLRRELKSSDGLDFVAEIVGVSVLECGPLEHQIPPWSQLRYWLLQTPTKKRAHVLASASVHNPPAPHLTVMTTLLASAGGRFSAVVECEMI
jgi:hypothetical protein